MAFYRAKGCELRFPAALLVGLMLISGAFAAGEAVEAPAPAPMSAPEVITRVKGAMAAAGTIRARLTLRCNHPAAYTSEIEILASPTGDERAQIKTTIKENSFRTLEVISGGTLWSEQETVAGPIVGKIDLSRVKAELRERGEQYPAMPVLGANFALEVSNLARLVDFDRSEAAGSGDDGFYILTGSLRREFTEGKRPLPQGAVDFYRVVKLAVDASTFLPARIELGRKDGRPLVVVEIESLAANVETDEETFKYTPPEEAQIVDRTEWAIAELTGG